MVDWNGECSSTFSVGNGVKQGGVLSPVLFTVYLDGLIDQLKKKGLGCHFNGHFVGCFIYADDITLLAPSRDALNNMLDVCREYAEAYAILFNATKTKCMFFDRTHSTLFDKDIQLMGSPIGFVDKCKFLGFSISRDILNRDIQSSINTFNRKCNEVSLDFSILNSEIKSKPISIFCMDGQFMELWFKLC